MKHILCLSIVLVLVLFSSTARAGCYPMPIFPFFFCTLDTEGTASDSPPDYYTCHEDLALDQAGGDPYFHITMKGWCGVHPGGGIPGWTPVDWKYVTVSASYNYATKSLSENITYDNNKLIEQQMTCGDNPYGFAPACNFSVPLVNNTGAVVNGPYPFATNWMPYSLRQAIAELKDYQSPEEMLEDWDPYAGQDEPRSQEITITNPGQYDIIPEGNASFTLEVGLQSGAETPQGIEMQWQQIIPAPEWQGDIRPPENIKYLWQPFLGPPTAQWADFPLEIAVTSGYFQNKPGLYELSLRNIAKNGWSAPVRFWIGNPTFDPPPLSFRNPLNIKRKLTVADKARENRRLVPSGKILRQKAIAAKPHLKVSKVTWNNAARPGNNLDLVITVSNQGTVASKPSQYSLFIACLPASECGRTATAIIPSEIAPGSSRTYTLNKAVRPEKGSTRFFVSTEPMMNLTRSKK